MRIVLSFFFIVICIHASEIEFQGDIGVEYKRVSYDSVVIPNKISKSINGQVELTKQFEEYLAFLKIEMLEDKDDSTRNYTKVNEAYLKYEAQDYEIKAGKDIKFWGTLELHNITDIYNLKNLKYDLFDKDKKLGSVGVTFIKYLENEDELLISRNSIDNYKTNFIKYSGSRDFIGAVDFNFLSTNSNDKNKFLTYNTMVKDDTLYKVEYSYSNNKSIDNFYELGLGVEHTLYGLINQKDLGILIEYYKSDNKNLTYQNDLFIGARVTFNDVSSSDIITGVVVDNDTKEKTYSFEYNTRLFDQYKSKITYIKNDLFSQVSLNIGYYF